MNIEFLDCTLRDGAHVNAGNFGERHIKNIINGLTMAQADIVELGFLKDIIYSKDVTSFPTIEYCNNFLAEMNMKEKTRYALMVRADQYDINNLSYCQGSVSLIRIAFYYDHLNEAISFAKTVKKRGYDCTLNLINTPGNGLKNLHKVVAYANEIGPYALTIVDTYGILDIEQLQEITLMYNEELSEDICVGLHVHENMSLSFSLAKWFIKNLSRERGIIIDGSLMGIGRAPGNLCSELIIDYLNDNYEKKYNLNELLNLIENDIFPIKQQFKWGYSPEYFLSAKYKVHRSYAEYLIENNIDLANINYILSQITPEKGAKFDVNYLESLIKYRKE